MSVFNILTQTRFFNLWQFKSALFKTLVKQNEPTGFPPEKFYAISTFIYEDKHITATWVLSQPAAY